MNRQEALEVWSRVLVDEPVLPATREELHRTLEQDAALRDVVLADWSMDCLLRSRVLEQESDRSFLTGFAGRLAARGDSARFAASVRAKLDRRRPPSARRRRILVISTITLLAAAAGLAIALMMERAPVRTQPDLPALATGERLQQAERFVAPSDIELRWNDGTVATAAAGSVLAFADPSHGKAFGLELGRLRVIAAEQPSGRPMTIRTPHTSVVVVGTEFLLTADASETRLEVIHGRVRLGPSTLVEAGRSALADRSGIRLVLPEPIASLDSVWPMPGWDVQEIGASPLRGQGPEIRAGIWTMSAAGKDIGGTSDQFRFASTTLTGDGTLTMRVVAVTGEDRFDKAGLMFRAGTEVDAPFVLIDVSHLPEMQVLWREVSGGPTTNPDEHWDTRPPQVFPIWLRLRRQGSVITPSASFDGVVWQQLPGPPAGPAFSGPLRVGVAACSRRDDVLLRATFDHVTITLEP